MEAVKSNQSDKSNQSQFRQYLQELTLFQYIQVTGGNRFREGYQYKITAIDNNNTLNNSIEKALNNTLETIKAEYSKTESQTPPPSQQPAENEIKKSRTTKKLKNG